MGMMRLLVVFRLSKTLFVLLLPFVLVALVAEGIAWACWLLLRLLVICFDVILAAWRLRHGRLRCPAGHDIATEGTFRCSYCDYMYAGPLAAFRCENTECDAPAAAFVDCQVCGLSSRVPFRWGRS